MHRVLVVLALAACADESDDEAHVLDGQSFGNSDGKADGTLRGETLRFALDHAAVMGTSDRPNAVVYVPDGYDASHPEVVVFLHGFYNCAANVLRGANGTCGGAVRNAYNLAGQLDAAGKHPLLVVPELAYDRASSDPGDFATPGVFSSMIDDLFAALGDRAGSVDNLAHVVVASHSGGYRAAAAIATAGGKRVDELWLLDSLYGETDAFDAFAQRPPARFTDIYTVGGGTLAASQAMIGRVAAWEDASEIVDDRGKKILTDDDFEHAFVWKQSGLAHDDVPRYYFGRLLATSGLD
jgi:pimeloyl-ACP methyl ester carboxylesterase